ncbi:MAG: neocarzinostatin apoprotein domain-containing protein, partial [Nitrososphaerales archaeon]
MLPTTNAAAGSSTAIPMISLSRSARLFDGEVVMVTGSGFSQPPSQVGLSECATRSNSDCVYEGSFSVGPAGALSVPYTVDRTLIIQTTAGLHSVDCASTACVLRAQDFHTGQSVEAHLAFNANAPSRVKVNVDHTAQVDPVTGAVTVEGSVSCVKTSNIELTGTINQSHPPLVYQQRLFADPAHLQRILCHKRVTPWSTRVSPWPGRIAPGGAAGNFSGGKATVSVEVTPTISTTPISLKSASVRVSGTTGSPHPVYYLALGESLAHGFAAAPGLGYTNDLLAYLRKRIPNLQLVELSCNDETTSQAIKGDSCSYGKSAGGAPLTQLQAAEAFLELHRTSVALITIDLGGVDLIRCSAAACVSQVEPTLAANLTTIVKGLHRAAGAAPIVADNYFDPVLSDWFQGPSRQAYAT